VDEESDPSDQTPSYKATDSSGQAVFYVLPACKFTLAAQIPGVASSSSVPVEIQPNAVKAPTIMIDIPSGLGAIEGRCIDSCGDHGVITLGRNGELQSFARVRTMGAGLPEESMPDRTYVGAFSFTNIPPGKYVIGAADTHEVSEPFEVQAGQVRSIAMRVESGGAGRSRIATEPNVLFLSAYHRVADELLPLQGVKIKVLDSIADEVFDCEDGPESSTRLDGMCQPTLLPPGEYAVEASLPGYRTVQSTLVMTADHWTDQKLELEPVRQGSSLPVAATQRLSPSPRGGELIVATAGSLVSLQSLGLGYPPPVKLQPGFFEYGKPELLPGTYTLSFKQKDDEQ
jgi:hypothetical protein